MHISDWVTIGGMIVTIIGIIVACIGGKELKEANEIKNQLGDIKAKIEKLEISNSQFANTINNNGIGMKEAEHVAKKVANKKTKNKPDLYYSEREPKKAKEMSGWISDEEDISNI